MEIRILKLGLALLALGFWACKKPCDKTCENPFDAERGSTAKDAAEKMKPMLTQLIDSLNYQVMGFHSVKEVERVELGNPVVRVRLRCDSLKTYKATKGENLSPLAMSEQIIFPILVDKQARAVLVVDSIPEDQGRSKLDWITVTFGNAPLAALIDSTIGLRSNLSEAARVGYSLVDIPALRLSFFRHPKEDQSVLSLAQNVGSPCWADSLPTTMPLTATLSVLAGCVEAHNLCSDEPRPFKGGAQPAPRQDSSASPKKPEKRSAN